MRKRLLIKDKTRDAKHADAITAARTASHLIGPNSLIPPKSKYVMINDKYIPATKISWTIGVKATVKLTNVGIIIV